MHEVITVSVPVFAVLSGILVNRVDMRHLEKRLEETEKRLDAKIDAHRAETKAGLDRVNDHLIQFHSITGKAGRAAGCG